MLEGGIVAQYMPNAAVCTKELLSFHNMRSAILAFSEYCDESLAVHFFC